VCVCVLCVCVLMFRVQTHQQKNEIIFQSVARVSVSGRGSEKESKGEGGREVCTCVYM
jgi:hypothetical protein